MPLHFNPLVFGVMVVVAFGTLAYGLWTRQTQPPHSYGSEQKSYDYQPGYDTCNRWDDKPDNERRKRRTKNGNCTICLDVLKIDLRTLSCQHVFHKDCIKVWLYSNSTCPICRKTDTQ